MSNQTASASSLMDDFHALIPGQAGAPRHEVFARLRAELPVFRSDKLGCWVVASYDGVKSVLTDVENLKAPDDVWKVRLVEKDFHRLMFDTEGA